MLALGVLLALGASGCGDPTVGNHPVHPTHAGPNGECVEFDGEPCDDDPFDLDDLFEGHKTKGPSAKPKPKPTPAKPAPVRTRRR